ncbi:hypothetical protein KM043_002956 [Ampulex compressa]|nr:hypothetical protein KM043_002956 [Ampulex compressa]
MNDSAMKRTRGVCLVKIFFSDGVAGEWLVRAKNVCCWRIIKRPFSSAGSFALPSSSTFGFSSQTETAVPDTAGAISSSDLSFGSFHPPVAPAPYAHAFWPLADPNSDSPIRSIRLDSARTRTQPTLSPQNFALSIEYR